MSHVYQVSLLCSLTHLVPSYRNFLPMSWGLQLILWVCFGHTVLSYPAWPGSQKAWVGSGGTTTCMSGKAASADWESESSSDWVGDAPGFQAVFTCMIHSLHLHLQLCKFTNSAADQQYFCYISTFCNLKLYLFSSIGTWAGSSPWRGQGQWRETPWENWLLHPSMAITTEHPPVVSSGCPVDKSLTLASRPCVVWPQPASHAHLSPGPASTPLLHCRIFQVSTIACIPCPFFLEHSPPIFFTHMFTSSHRDHCTERVFWDGSFWTLHSHQACLFYPLHPPKPAHQGFQWWSALLERRRETERKRNTNERSGGTNEREWARARDRAARCPQHSRVACWPVLKRKKRVGSDMGIWWQKPPKQDSYFFLVLILRPLWGRQQHPSGT